MEDAAAIGKASKAAHTLDAYWVSSWAALNEQGKILKIICEWDAKDAQSIRRVCDKIPNLPVDGIWPMAKVDGETYR